MRFEIFTLVAGLAATCAADAMAVIERCPHGQGCDRSRAVFYTDYGGYNVDANGCGSSTVPGMVEFCIDGYLLRGHFRYSHDSRKRCLRQGAGIRLDYWNKADVKWALMTWDEVPCTW